MKGRRRARFVTSASFPPDVLDDVDGMFLSAIAAIGYVTGDDGRWAEFTRVTVDPEDAVGGQAAALRGAMAADLDRFRQYRQRLSGLASQIAAVRGGWTHVTEGRTQA